MAELATRVRLYGFDPDEAECARLTAAYDNPDIVLVPCALGSRHGTATLYTTREPACSSIYRPIAELIAATPELACATETGSALIDITTLDDWCEAGGVTRVDCIKLDVQGAELDVLQGALRTLRSVRVIETEVEFNPIYQGQPLFGDVDAFLRDQGFVLWKLGTLVHYSDRPDCATAPAGDVFYYDSKPVAVAAMGGQLSWGHAFYVRPETAAGGATLGRAARLRDADLLRVLGFHDLVERLLDEELGSPSTA